MKKKLFSTLLVIAMVLALLPTGAAAYGEFVYDPTTDLGDYDIVGDDNYYYEIDYDWEGNGFISVPRRAEAGEWVDIIVHPDNGYKVESVYVYGATCYEGNDGNYYFRMPDDDVFVYAVFTDDDDVWNDGDYSLDCSVDPWRGATATFYDEDDRAVSSADAGDKVTLTVSAEKGYKIDSVWSSEAGWVYSDYYWQYNDSYFTYSFTMPEDDVYFEVELTGDGEFDIETTSNGYYGSVSIDGNIDSADRGDVVSFTVTPRNGYIVESVTVYDEDYDPVTVTRNSKDWNSFSFTMPNSDVEIHVTYTDDYHEITMDVGRNGTATPDAEPSGYFGYVYYGIDGERIYVNATPDKGYEVKSVSVTDEKGKKVSVYEALKENQYYFTMPESDVTVTVEFQYRELTNPFTDVKTTDWFYDAVSYVYTEGLMTGTGSYTFSPNGTTSRAMLVTILWRLQGEPYVSGYGFNDVKSSAYYYDAVRWAARYGIVEGYEGNVFKPDDAITREQFAAILYRYADYCNYNTSASTNLSAYKDSAKVSSWATTSMKWAVAEGLFEGDNLGNLDPQGQTTRAACAKLLMAFCENVVY